MVGGVVVVAEVGAVVVVELDATGAAVVVEAASIALVRQLSGWGRWDTQDDVLATSLDAPSLATLMAPRARPPTSAVSGSVLDQGGAGVPSPPENCPLQQGPHVDYLSRGGVATSSPCPQRPPSVVPLEESTTFGGIRREISPYPSPFGGLGRCLEGSGPHHCLCGAPERPPERPEQAMYDPPPPSGTALSHPRAMMGP